jgi:RecA/RadA recombinase
MSSALMQRLLKATTRDDVAALDQSALFNEKDFAPTSVPILNVALSGRVKGGLPSGILSLAAESKHFKTNFALLLVAAYLRKHKDAVCVLMDSEFGITPEYLKSFGIDPSRVIHIPIYNIEQLTFEFAAQLKEIKRNEKVVFLVDSVGNLASKKEVENAENENSAADMTRARALKSMFRIITPHFQGKNIPCIVINHTYNEIGMFPKQIMGGGQGGMLSSNTVLFISKSQDKDGTELQGFKFTLIVEKSRFVKEKSKFPIHVSFEGGVQPLSGIFELALESGDIISPTKGFYQFVDKDTGELLFEGKKFRRAEIEATNQYLMDVLRRKSFRDHIEDTYMLKATEIDSNHQKEFDDFIDAKDD